MTNTIVRFSDWFSYGAAATPALTVRPSLRALKLSPLRAFTLPQCPRDVVHQRAMPRRAGTVAYFTNERAFVHILFTPLCAVLFSPIIQAPSGEHGISPQK